MISRSSSRGLWVAVYLGYDFEELVDYEEKKEKASDSAAKVNGSPQKGITWNSQFKVQRFPIEA
ncbi:hypothetical protein C1H46_006788 [Malus baccata]|uniref:Uncharacterized protein n=1 Tax=Malus baccata TaxID=106549 RepID=A0A540N8T6_MALBA|nr:hypothetical protein C1H46_006788 [Malus baccata]